MRSHSRRFLVGLLAGSGLLVGTSVNADATPDVEPAEVEQLDAADLEQMGIDTSTATDEWRIEKFEFTFPTACSRVKPRYPPDTLAPVPV